MRLIDADALFNWGKHKLSDAVKYGNKDEEHQDFSYSTLMMYEIADEVDEAPTIDAVPVVRGEWIEKTYIHEYANEETEERQYVVCSICGKQPPSGFGAVNFCHNCGADMRRESEGST